MSGQAAMQSCSVPGQPPNPFEALSFLVYIIEGFLPLLPLLFLPGAATPTTSTDSTDSTDSESPHRSNGLPSRSRRSLHEYLQGVDPLIKNNIV